MDRSGNVSSTWSWNSWGYQEYGADWNPVGDQHPCVGFSSDWGTNANDYWISPLFKLEPGKTYVAKAHTAVNRTCLEAATTSFTMKLGTNKKVQGSFDKTLGAIELNTVYDRNPSMFEFTVEKAGNYYVAFHISDATGENAYGYLKSEAGVHRLVRVSPFDSAGRRHTSFSSLEVMPEIAKDTEVHIPPEDIKMDVYRASGAGGQKVNKTSSAVRLTHIPTGIVVASQVERSQYQNRDVAMNMLISKLVEIKEREHLEKIEDIKGVQKEITWGSQIRSYVFMPYTMVKDHRTGFETGNIQAVMDGDLDGFINAYLKCASLGTLQK